MLAVRNAELVLLWPVMLVLLLLLTTCFFPHINLMRQRCLSQKSNVTLEEAKAHSQYQEHSPLSGSRLAAYSQQVIEQRVRYYSSVGRAAWSGAMFGTIAV